MPIDDLMSQPKYTAVQAEVVEVNDAVVTIARQTQESLNQLLPILEKGIGSRQLELARDHLENAVMRLKAHGNKGRFIE